MALRPCWQKLSLGQVKPWDVQADNELGAIGGHQERDVGVCLELAQNLMSHIGRALVQADVGIIEEEVIGPDG